MSVISISISESSEQLVEGIPKFITLTTNLPATIFYTLDGSVPSLLSSIYVSPILMPVNKPGVVLQAFASDGTNTSAIITETYTTNRFTDSVRGAHASTSDSPGNITPNLYPYGSSSPQPNSTYGSPANSGYTVDDPTLTQIPNGFDGAGNQTAFTNLPYNIENYEIEAFTTNSEGEKGLGIGDLANITILPEEPISESSEQFTTSFDPRSPVIMQDFSKEDPNDPAQINNQFITTDNDDRSTNGNKFYSSGLDAPTVRGSFLRPYYNPRTNNFHYYYFDSFTNKWIMSIQPHISGAPSLGDISGGYTNSREPGSRYVFEWLTYKRQILF